MKVDSNVIDVINWSIDHDIQSVPVGDASVLVIVVYNGGMSTQNADLALISK
jgi:hypothetical protein